MKQLYSDLLDSYGEEKIRLKKAPAVSSDRIYALANAKAGKENVFMKKKHNRLPVVLAVVVAAVLLMGAGYLVAYNSITDFFVRNWEDMTDTEITDEHLATIENFSQEIGLSQKSDGVTITVDSAAVGGDTFYVLFAVECNSVEFATTRSPSFDECRWDITNSSATVQSGGLMWGGTDENNVTYFVLEGGIDITDENEPIAVSVHLAGLHTNKDSTHEEYPDTYLGGSWDFEFTLEQNTLNSLSLLEDGERKTITIKMLDPDVDSGVYPYRDVTVDITSVTVNEFSATVTYDVSSASVPSDIYSFCCNYRDDVYAVMQDGSEIVTYFWAEDLNADLAGTEITIKSLWYSVIDLSELKAIRIGDTEFYVNTEESEAIESSVQEIGITETIESDITVTVDSAMASKNEMYFLLRIEGESIEGALDPSEHWYFDSCHFDIVNAITANYNTCDLWRYEEDGVYYWLWECNYETLSEDITSIDCTLDLGALHSNAFFDGDVVFDGSWSFEFTVDIGDITAISLTTEIPGISELEITEFGSSYLYTITDDTDYPVYLVAVMKDGTEVNSTGGTGYVERDENGDRLMNYSYSHYYYQWAVPIDLDEVDYLYFVDGARDFIEGTIIDFG
ncbi:MAG: DUF4179 domain-containing protein [Oscillospiraceae bacterium]|nr:DUF4179 domain-containing protein [Oscillospiraceae bacterium]